MKKVFIFKKKLNKWPCTHYQPCSVAEMPHNVHPAVWVHPKTIVSGELIANHCFFFAFFTLFWCDITSMVWYCVLGIILRSFSSSRTFFLFYFYVSFTCCDAFTLLQTTYSQSCKDIPHQNCKWVKDCKKVTYHQHLAWLVPYHGSLK